jgi:hypothetical protein
MTRQNPPFWGILRATSLLAPALPPFLPRTGGGAFLLKSDSARGPATTDRLDFAPEIIHSLDNNPVGLNER